jgi:hypothetical protein
LGCHKKCANKTIQEEPKKELKQIMSVYGHISVLTGKKTFKWTKYLVSDKYLNTGNAIELKRH